ncbi:MAG TPA: helix-turn-helix transcriptional regulator [Candidatus Acidoferrales bacterium]|nr:helix-turn-helix transcriptional regulator [Candidatus Acidoferrales bacterium]
MSDGPRETADQAMGARIRRLRLERGLTLARLAGDDFSRAFLSQIETGRSRPSTRVLTIIADRLGTQVDSILPGRREHLERELALERARVAILRARPRLALTLLEALGEVPDWPFGADVAICLAQALWDCDQVARASSILSQLQQDPRMRDDRARRRRIRAIQVGLPTGLPAPDHLRLAEQAMRRGNRPAALEHYRSARVLLELASRAEKPAR